MSISGRKKKSNGVDGQCTESATDTKQVDHHDNDGQDIAHDHHEYDYEDEYDHK